jgi:hypothetical protein
MKMEKAMEKTGTPAFPLEKVFSSKLSKAAIKICTLLI